MEKISLIFFLTSSITFLKNIALSIYIFRTYHFDNKIIVFRSIAFYSIQHFTSTINDFHLLKFQVSSRNTQRFKTNILILSTPEYQRGVTRGVGGGEVI